MNRTPACLGPLSAALALLALLPGAPARAEGPGDASGWRTTVTALARLNPLAMGVEGELAYRRRLYAAASPLLAQNQAGVAAAVLATPASLGPSLRLELQPLSVLSLGAAYEPTFYLGTAGMAQSYPSPRVHLGGGAFRPVEEGPGGAYALAVHRLALRGALQARAGSVAVRAAVEASRFDARLHGRDRVLYDATRDVLVYRHGWAAQGDLDLAWLAGEGLVLGARATAVTAWYPAGAFAGGDRGGLKERTTLRAGPVLRVPLFRGRGGLLDEGALVAVIQWWLAHPDRAGRSSPQAVPLALLLLQVSGTP